MRCPLRHRCLKICFCRFAFPPHNVACRPPAHQCSLQDGSNHAIWSTRYIFTSSHRVSLTANLNNLRTEFNLDFYTEVQDLSHLENSLSASSPRFASLNMAICELIEDFGYVGFETLAVEVILSISLLGPQIQTISPGQTINGSSHANC